MSNITEVTFTTERYAVTEPLYQYDYGQVLKITAPSLPDPYTVHFGNARSSGDSLTVLGTASDGAAIPSALLATGLNVYAWVFLHTGENDGETEYMIEIPVIRRAEPTDDPVIEEDPSAVDIIMGEIADLKEDIENISGISDDVKVALLDCFAHVAWTDEYGQDYYDALYSALYDNSWLVTNTLSHCSSSNTAESVTKGASYSATISADIGYSLTGASVSIKMNGVDITASAYNNGTISIAQVTGNLTITITAAEIELASISATYTQSGTVFETDSIDEFKNDLVVTATYSDSSTAVVPSADYTLSGTLESGTSVITVTYEEETTTFNVTVAGLPTGYTALDYVSMNGNQYANSGCYESANPLSGEIKFRITTAPTSAAPNPHIMSSTNLFYPYLSGDQSMTVIKMTANGTENTGIRVPGSAAWAIDTDYKFKADLNENKLYLDDVYIHDITVGSTYSASNQLTIGTYGGSPSTTKYRLKGRIYYIKLYDDSGVAHYFKPAQRTSDSVIGFYDIVTDSFKTSATGTAFTGGNLT